jgi:hypothetical protein
VPDWRSRRPIRTSDVAFSLTSSKARPRVENWRRRRRAREAMPEQLAEIEKEARVVIRGKGAGTFQRMSAWCTRLWGGASTPAHFCRTGTQSGCACRHKTVQPGPLHAAPSPIPR